MEMSIFITRGRQKKPDGDYRYYYELRGNFYKDGAVRQTYVAYLGLDKTITLSKVEAAKERLKSKGIEVSTEDFQNVEELEIVEGVKQGENGSD